VAALAVAGVLDAFFIDEGVDVLEVPRGAEAVGVDGLAPLVIGLLMAVAAILGCVKAFGADKLAGGGGGVGGQEWSLFAEGVVVV
jgi:hypothetical protein